MSRGLRGVLFCSWLILFVASEATACPTSDKVAVKIPFLTQTQTYEFQDWFESEILDDWFGFNPGWFWRFNRGWRWGWRNSPWWDCDPEPEFPGVPDAPEPVPEPATIALLGLGAGGTLLARRRRKGAKS